MNEQNETFGAKLTLITSEFKNKLKEVSNLIKNFGKEAEEETSIMPKLNNTGYEKQIEYIKSQMQKIQEQKETAFKFSETDLEKYNRLKNVLKEIEEEFETTSKINLEKGIPNDKSTIIQELQRQKEIFTNELKDLETGSYDTDKVLKLEAQYEVLENKLNKLIKKQEDYNGELEDTEEEIEDINKTSSRSTLGQLFDKSIGKIKRFTFYLLGARSVFSMFMKYQNIYYQYNEKMQYQSELSQNAIALSLAPAFEFLGNMVAYASIGFAKFIELLTGVNVLSKVSTKGIRDYNKSLKETQTLVSGIDEITNLTMPSGTGLASQYQALDDFKKKIAEVEEWFSKNKWIEDLAKGIRGIYDFVYNNWDIFKYVFGAVAIGVIGLKLVAGISGISNVIGSAGSLGAMGTVGTGLAGLTSLLSYLSTISILYFTLKISSAIGDNLTKNLISWIMGKSKEASESGATKDVQALYNEIEKSIKKLSTLDTDSDEYKKTVEDIQKKWNDVNTILGEDKLLLDENKKTAEELKLEFDKVYGSSYKTEIDLELPTYKMNLWEKFLSGFYQVLGQTVNPFSPGLARYFYVKSTTVGYANGLDYVPYDEYPALLHKGEAVVPAKYNPTIHSQGNEETNALLETLIMKVDDLSRRPNVFEVDGQQFASATYNLYHNEENRQNYNAKVRVNNG